MDEEKPLIGPHLSLRFPSARVTATMANGQASATDVILGIFLPHHPQAPNCTVPFVPKSTFTIDNPSTIGFDSVDISTRTSATKMGKKSHVA